MNEKPPRPTIVPDQTGTYLIQFCNDGKDGVSTQWLPVLAWLIEAVFNDVEGNWRTITIPIVCEDIADMLWCLWHPKHGYVVPDDCSMETEEAVMEWARDELHARNERQRKALEKTLAKRQAALANVNVREHPPAKRPAPIDVGALTEDSF